MSTDRLTHKIDVDDISCGWMKMEQCFLMHSSILLLLYSSKPGFKIEAQRFCSIRCRWCLWLNGRKRSKFERITSKGNALAVIYGISPRASNQSTVGISMYVLLALLLVRIDSQSLFLINTLCIYFWCLFLYFYYFWFMVSVAFAWLKNNIMAWTRGEVLQEKWGVGSLKP